jgi:hypothetical protein
VNSNNKRHLSEQVRRFRACFAQGMGTKLGEVVPAGLLKQWVVEEAGRWRNRLYGPLVTLKLFLEQVLSADQSCQDAVARGLSERVSLEQAPYSPPCVRIDVASLEEILCEPKGAKVGTR